MQKDVILFDGVCNFCNASINFVIDHDKSRRFYFASLQSDYGQAILREHHRTVQDFETVLLVREGKLYEKSTAVLEIARHLVGWRWLYLFRFLPTSIRDFVYGLIARNRYSLFGKADACRIPTKEERALFLG
ncbi:DCC1-like thiol-disulfide oxidoreductase family protein [Runella sp. MFBS21]|uniref:thiol-disulfide oxidoreductase DCC family protein n=1 Tax=Runella sp. MFBS21 TaxID=3034018 RepID=UPI0023F7A460|nr:DCC1-like thiol-disulfide oxidoreductase family protein [Runella sp. MFBS21]MDF7822246.1 DCC1-like thiol-disulfide oxidoreductase family protein [Runella sp. MFBS21]